MVQRVYERQGRGTIQGSSIVKSSCDSHRCLVDIGNTEIYFPHPAEHSSSCDGDLMIVEGLDQQDQESRMPTSSKAVHVNPILRERERALSYVAAMDIPS